MNTPLYNKLLSINTYPFHMPGHKRRFSCPDLLRLDLTEIPGTDNLHNPHNVILQAQELAAEAVGADKSLFCVNGGSSGILTAVLGTCSPDDRLLTVKNAHKSIYNGIILSGCQAAFISPEITPYGVCGGVDVKKIETALQKYDDIKAVLIVSPTYEGFVCDIKSIAETVHKYNKILIVDETHGSHFPFNESFPSSAISVDADISINSWHKTLPALGQSAIINIKSNLVDFDKIRSAHSMVNTTSPSYMLMGVMDYVRGYITENKGIFQKYAESMLSFQEKFNKLKAFESASKLKGSYSIFDYDISKITLFFNNNYTADYIENTLTENKLQPELIDNLHLIAMTSVADDISYIQKLFEVLNKLDNTDFVPKGQKYRTNDKITTADLRKYYYMPKEEVDLNNAEGKISAEFITPFPPDIPIIIPGEEITKEHINFINNSHTEILGINKGKIKILKKE